MQWQVKINTVFQRYLNQYLLRHPSLIYSLHVERNRVERYYSIMLKQTRMFFVNRLNPYNLCPNSIFFWFQVYPYNTLGISILGLREVGVYWRQQIEPNETIFLSFKILDIKPPFPLTLLLLFSAFGLVIVDGANILRQSAGSEFEHEQTNNEFLHSFDLFRLTPRISIFFPVFSNHTSLGFLTIDFKQLQLSVKQSLEPNETIISLIRFMNLYTPFPLQLIVMLLSVGLFMTGEIYKFGQTIREEVFSEGKRAI